MNQEEEILRENIRHLIKYVKQKKLNEEQEIRNSLKQLMRIELKQMLSEEAIPDQDPAPNKSTGMIALGFKPFSLAWFTASSIPAGSILNISG